MVVGSSPVAVIMVGDSHCLRVSVSSSVAKFGLYAAKLLMKEKIEKGIIFLKLCFQVRLTSVTFLLQ